MAKENIVFIGTSLDGYIADKNGGIDWLNSIPNPEKDDMGFNAFNERIDGIIMGRNTYEMVCSFDIDWPYQVPVFVLSTTLTSVPEKLKDKVELVKGSLTEVLKSIHDKGHDSLYIDGGSTIQSFLKEDLIDELIISKIPVLLGGGIPLFGEHASPLSFNHVKSEVFVNQIVQDTYRRNRA